jgi:hypothetical protein
LRCFKTFLSLILPTKLFLTDFFWSSKKNNFFFQNRLFIIIKNLEKFILVFCENLCFLTFSASFGFFCFFWPWSNYYISHVLYLSPSARIYNHFKNFKNFNVSLDLLLLSTQIFEFLISCFSLLFCVLSFVLGHLIVLFSTTKRPINSSFAFLNFLFGHGQNLQNHLIHTVLTVIIVDFLIFLLEALYLVKCARNWF